MKQLESQLVQLDAPILPNQGLAGFLLRTHVRDLQEMFTNLALAEEITFELSRLFEARYRLGGGSVELAVDVRNGRVFRISAYSGYRGLLFGKITVGMTVREAMALVPSLYYDEAEEVVRCKDCEGVSVDVAQVDPLPHLVADMTIHAINVHAVEIDMLTGQDGHW
jgi:hypothetical protein